MNIPTRKGSDTMRTKDGKYNPERIDKVYEEVKKKLNNTELSFLCDKLVWDKHYLIKTVKLIMLDVDQVTAHE